MRRQLDGASAGVGLWFGWRNDLGSTWTGRSRVVLDRIAVTIDLPDDLVHTDDALDLLLSLVLSSLWVICASTQFLEVEVVVVGVWVAAEGQRNEESAAQLLLIVQYDELSDQEADEEAYEGQIRLLLKEIARATVHVNAQEHLRRRLTNVEAHGRMVSPRVPLVVVGNLRNPECARGDEQNGCIVEEDVLLSEVNDETEVDAEVEY